MKKITLILLYCYIVILSGCQNKPFYKESRFLMGTTAEIICQDRHSLDIAFREIERLERLWNRYDPDSEISKLNKNGVSKVSKDTLEIIKKAIEFSKLSEGLFDITIGPLADLWKERIKSKVSRFPTEEEITERLRFIGFEKIIIDEEKSVIKFKDKGVSVDLGGIAQGYAVDKVVEKLRSLGVKDCLIRIGGCIYALGRKDKRDWRIGIQHPRNPHEFIDYVELRDKAIATSGDYEQFFIYEGKRYSHIINPKTGYPVDNEIISVTVISPQALISDFLSTAVFILGEEKGRELAKKFKDTKVIIFTEQDI